MVCRRGKWCLSLSFYDTYRHVLWVYTQILNVLELVCRYLLASCIHYTKQHAVNNKRSFLLVNIILKTTWEDGLI